MCEWHEEFEEEEDVLEEYDLNTVSLFLLLQLLIVANDMSAIFGEFVCLKLCRNARSHSLELASELLGSSLQMANDVAVVVADVCKCCAILSACVL